MHPTLLFDISGGELLVILLFVLLFFGSKGIPDVARTMGRAMRQLRDATDDVQREIRKGASDIQHGLDADERPRPNKRTGPGPPEGTRATSATQPPPTETDERSV
ncbi:MAG: twin-arginine translocase TatA/TatE family subunit [Flavobacteriales bacterium]|nr:twin-arginine translocase TatA/TatE family subunit [Flavobacteriales bacterium]MCB9167689.1 twin-arginine translocase TatA/TatE family subunit [Flavobacteriales bacterium]